jgi:hypothetical protein
MRGDRRTRRLPDKHLTTVLGIHVAARLLMLGTVAVAAAIHPLGTGSLGGDLGAALGKSDGVWYLGIAHHGYGPPPPIGADGVYTHLTSLAFFPLYPLLVRLVALTGMPYLGAALAVTFVAGAVAAVLIAAWVAQVANTRAALAVVVIWELLPSSVVLSMAYSEALFAAAAAGCLLALHHRRWLLAGGAASIGGLTRPTGGCLVLAVVVAASLDLRHTRSPAGSTAGDHPVWRPLAAVVLSAAGLAAALIHVAVVTGRIDGWFWIERTVWQSGFDGGASAAAHVGQLVTGGRAAHRLPEVVAAVLVLATVGLAGWLWRSRRRLHPAGSVYAASAAILAVGQRGYFYVKPRLLFVAFPAFLPVGTWLGRQPRHRLVLIGVPALVLSLVYNAYLLAGWHRAL